MGNLTYISQLARGLEPRTGIFLRGPGEQPSLEGRLLPEK